MFRKPTVVVFTFLVFLRGRTVFDLPPNVELVTLSCFLSSVYLGEPFAVLVPLTIMVVSDSIIGNTQIFIFTWSAYVLIGIGALFLRPFKKDDVNLFSAATLFTIPSSLFFYLWTNFGVWYQGWYPPTPAGLVESYVRGLPFLKFNLIGNLIFISLGFGLIAVARRLILSLTELAPLHQISQRVKIILR